VRGGAITRYALDADGGPPADYAGLVGTALPAGRKAHLGGLEKVAAVTLDANGDGRPDFFVVAPAGGLLMVSRGFGAFFTSAEAGDAVTSDGPRKVPFAIGPETAWTAADLDADGADDIVVLTEDGRLLAVSNPPAAKH
ncbi:MAG: VCBS repeat-containing protein, partial [Planctomycetes bacterium]|nr:VCBS repeat-containing protein [Planctomycetota bacterium]